MARDKEAPQSPPKTPPPRPVVRQPLIIPAASSVDEGRTPTTASLTDTRSSGASGYPGPWSRSDAESGGSEATGASDDDSGWDNFTGVRETDFQTSPTPARYGVRESQFPGVGDALGAADLSSEVGPPRPGDDSRAPETTPEPPKDGVPAEEDSSRTGHDKPDRVSTPEPPREKLDAAAHIEPSRAKHDDPDPPFTPEPKKGEPGSGPSTPENSAPQTQKEGLDHAPSTPVKPLKMKLEIRTQNPSPQPGQDPYEGLTPRAARALALADWDRAAAAMRSPPISESSGDESSLEPPVANLTPDEIKNVMLEKRDMEARKTEVDAEKLLLQQECARMLSIAKGYRPADRDASEAEALGRAGTGSSKPKAEVLEELKRSVGDAIRVCDGEAALHRRRVVDVEADDGMELEECAERLTDAYAAIHGYVTRGRNLGLWQDTLDRLIAGATLEESVSRWKAKRDESNDLERRIYKADRKVRKWKKANKGKKLPKIEAPPATTKPSKPKKPGLSPADLRAELKKLTPLPAAGVTAAWLEKNFPFPKSWAEWEHQHELLSAHTAVYVKKQKAPLRKEVSRLKSDNAKLSAFDDVKTAQEALEVERRTLDEERAQLRAKEAKVAAFKKQVRSDVKAIQVTTKKSLKWIADIRDEVGRTIKMLPEDQIGAVRQADAIYKKVQDGFEDACAQVQLAQNTITEFRDDREDHAKASPWGLVVQVERRDRKIDSLERELATLVKSLSTMVAETAKLQDKTNASPDFKVLSSDVAGILSVAQELLQEAEDAQAQSASPAEDEDSGDMARSDAFGNVVKMLTRCNRWTATFEGRLQEYKNLCREYKAAGDEANRKAKEFRVVIAGLRGENAALQGAAAADKEAALAEREAAHSRVIQAKERKLSRVADQLKRCEEDFHRTSKECEELQEKVREQEEKLLALPAQSPVVEKGDANIPPKDAAKKLEEGIQTRAQKEQAGREDTASQRGSIQALVRKNRMLTKDLEDMTEKYESRLDSAAEAARALAELHETQIALRKSQNEYQMAQREIEEIREEKRELEHYKLDSQDVDFGVKYGSEKAGAELEMEKVEWQTKEKELNGAIENKALEITKLKAQLDDTRKDYEAAIERLKDLAAAVTSSQEFPEEKVKLLQKCISARASLERELQRLKQKCATLTADRQRATEKARGLNRDVIQLQNTADKRREDIVRTVIDRTKLQARFDNLALEATRLRRLVNDQQRKAEDLGAKQDDTSTATTKEVLMKRVERLKDNLKLALDSVGSEYLDPDKDEPTIRDSKRLFRLSYDVLSWMPSKKEPTRPVFTKGDMHNVWMLQAIQNMRMDICRVMSYHDYTAAAKALAKLEDHVQNLDLNVFTTEVLGSIEVLRTWISFHSGRDRRGAEAALQRALSLKPETWAPEYREMLKVLEEQFEAVTPGQGGSEVSGEEERCRCRFKRFPCDLHRNDDCGCKFQTVIEPCDGHSYGKASSE